MVIYDRSLLAVAWNFCAIVFSSIRQETCLSLRLKVHGQIFSTCKKTGIAWNALKSNFPRQSLT